MKSSLSGSAICQHSAERWIRVLVIFASCALSARVYGWEGHDWNQWRQVTTWQKPILNTHQAGVRELAPLLGGDQTNTGGIASVAGWERRRKGISDAIQKILGQPTDLKRPALEVRELGSEDLDSYTRRHLLIRSEPDDWIPAYLLVPKKVAASQVPAIICLHQTVAQGKEEP